jgi:pyrimidine-nucleoside phosphorylase
LPVAPVIREVRAPASGFVRALGAIRIGTAALHLGAGRRTKDDEVDHAVGIVVRAKRGDRIEAGQPIAEVHARTAEAADDATREVLAAYELGNEPPTERPVLIEVVA